MFVKSMKSNEQDEKKTTRVWLPVNQSMREISLNLVLNAFSRILGWCCLSLMFPFWGAAIWAFWIQCSFSTCLILIGQIPRSIFDLYSFYSHSLSPPRLTLVSLSMPGYLVSSLAPFSLVFITHLKASERKRLLYCLSSFMYFLSYFIFELLFLYISVFIYNYYALLIREEVLISGVEFSDSFILFRVLSLRYSILFSHFHLVHCCPS